MTTSHVRRVLTLALFSATFAITSLAQTNEAAYDKIIKEFFVMLQKAQYGEAVDFIYADNPWLKSKADDIQKLRSQFVGLPNIVGKYLDNSVLTSNEIGGRFVHLDYFVAFERQPVRFKFQFYKPADKWTLFAFAYNDDLGDWLSEASKTSFQLKKIN